MHTVPGSIGPPVQRGAVDRRGGLCGVWGEAAAKPQKRTTLFQVERRAWAALRMSRNQGHGGSVAGDSPPDTREPRMSESTDNDGPLDMRATLAKLDCERMETQKLLAEAGKFNRDIWIVPLTVMGTILAAVVARLPAILHAFGWADR
jgi:hypothetical protein